MRILSTGLKQQELNYFVLQRQSFFLLNLLLIEIVVNSNFPRRTISDIPCFGAKQKTNN